jgi:hypothetical protein
MPFFHLIALIADVRANQRFVARRKPKVCRAARQARAFCSPGRPSTTIPSRHQPQTRQGPVVSRPIQSHETCPANHGAVKRHGSAPREPPPPGCPRGSERLEAAPATPFAGTAIRTCLLFTMTSEQAHRTSPRRDPPGRKAVLSFPVFSYQRSNNPGPVIQWAANRSRRGDWWSQPGLPCRPRTKTIGEPFLAARGLVEPARPALQAKDQSDRRANPRRARIGGADRDRTDDLKLAKLPLSQLSYGPVTVVSVPEARDQRARPHGCAANAVPRPVRQPCGSCHWGGPPACLAGQATNSQAHNEVGGPE